MLCTDFGHDYRFASSPSTSAGAKATAATSIHNAADHDPHQTYLTHTWSFLCPATQKADRPFHHLTNCPLFNHNGVFYFDSILAGFDQWASSCSSFGNGPSCLRCLMTMRYGQTSCLRRAGRRLRGANFRGWKCLVRWGFLDFGVIRSLRLEIVESLALVWYMIDKKDWH